jgi:hypothetical protein
VRKEPTRLFDRFAAEEAEEAEEDMDLANDTAKRTFSLHSTLLGRGFSLSSPPTVAQALDGVLPYR